MEDHENVCYNSIDRSNDLDTNIDLKIRPFTYKFHPYSPNKNNNPDVNKQLLNEMQNEGMIQLSKTGFIRKGKRSLDHLSCELLFMSVRTPPGILAFCSKPLSHAFSSELLLSCVQQIIQVEQPFFISVKLGKWLVYVKVEKCGLGESNILLSQLDNDDIVRMNVLEAVKKRNISFWFTPTATRCILEKV